MQTHSLAPAESSHDRSLRVIVLCLDALIVLASMGCSWGLHWLLRALPLVQAQFELRKPPAFEEYALLLYLTLPLFLLVIAAFDLHYWFQRPSSHLRLALELAKANFAVLVGLALLLFVTQAVINRSLLLLFLLSTFCLQFAVRVLLGHFRRFRHARARPRILLVGDFSRDMQAMIEWCQRAPFPPEIAGRLDGRSPPGAFVGSGGAAVAMLAPTRGDLPELSRILHEEPIDRVLFFPPLNQTALVSEALDLCETLGVPAGLAVDMTPHSASVPRIEFLYGHPFVEFDLARRAPGPLMLKHAFDVVAAALLTVLCAPVFALAALAILVTMGRPVLFIQERAGMRGRPFRMFKFRTMVVDAEAQQAALDAGNITGGPAFKLRDDPRVTALGRWLRSTSIDELPQLINVLTGHMSLVGPRPLPLREQAQISGWHRRRLSMKPGLTGLWQVSGRSTVAFERWMQLDLRYVDNWSWREDLKILCQTIPVLLGRRGAH